MEAKIGSPNSPCVVITHTCGHTREHRAHGSRVAWLESKPCPTCAGVPTKAVVVEPVKPPKARKEGKRLLTPDLRNFPPYMPEFRFCLTRKWRFDYAWPDKKIALEIEGSPGFGRHTYPKGFLSDMEKYNTALLLGWRVVRCVRRNDSINLALRILGQIL